MKFLGISEGALFCKQLPEGHTLQRINELLNPHNARCLLLTSEEGLTADFVRHGFASAVDDTRLGIWRYSFALERAMLSRIEREAKANRRAGRPDKAANALQRHYEQVNSGIFFEPDLYSRLQKLYSLWLDSPRLSLGCALEAAGQPFNANAPQESNSPALKEALYEGKHDLVQAAMWIEHRARLAVLKSVIDLILVGTEPRPVILSGGAPLITQWHFLPFNVRTGVETIRARGGHERFAVLWQQYLGTFGGFILADRQDAEYALLAAASGLSPSQIDHGLKCFDLLFPLADSWHWQARNSQCRLVRMVPSPWQGLGAFHRRLLYNAKTLGDLGYTDYTLKDLAKWHRAGHQWLLEHGDLPTVTPESEPA